MKDKNSPQPISSWIRLLNNGILLSDVDEATTTALCGHLADLGILEKVGEEEWKWALPPEDSSRTEEEIKKLLTKICDTEKGFALRYFLKDSPSSQNVDDSQPSESLEAESNPQLLGHKTSNLSNLQIVKKYGRQVQSFMELEKSYTERLLGPNTSLKEARKIFNFILGRMKQKTEPRSWEQLSRRRHK